MDNITNVNKLHSPSFLLFCGTAEIKSKSILTQLPKITRKISFRHDHFGFLSLDLMIVSPTLSTCSSPDDMPVWNGEFCQVV